jgi:hypothetical protein
MAFANARFVIRGLIVTVAAIGLAVLCWMSGADRMAADSPRLRNIHFGGSTAAQLAFDNLAQNDPHAAIGQAQWAVRTAPVDPAATSALGSASLALGQADRAYAAFAVAGRLGWRDIPTQLYWLTQGVATGDIDVVQPRLDALLRLDIDSDAVDSSLDLLERTRSGQVALATLLMENPPWESRFLVDTSQLDGDDFAGRVAAIDLAASKGAAIDCGAVGGAASRLIVLGRIGAAKDLWRRACDRAGDLYVSDGTFETDPAKLSTSPFNWRLLAQAGLDVDIAPAPHPLQGQALRISSSRTVRTVAARQLTALQPGRYHLAWTSALDNGKPDDSISVLIRCNGSDALDVARGIASAGQPIRTSETFTVPEQGCPIQAIDIQKAASMSGDAQTGWIDDIEIVPIG